MVNRIRNDFISRQWRSKGMANCVYVRGANYRGASNCAKVAFLSYSQIEMFSLYSLKYVGVV
jgi:hypothetical protein